MCKESTGEEHCSCGCGEAHGHHHAHEHAHGHEHGHEYEHEHHHHHGEHEDREGICMDTHEGAVIGSVKGTVAGNYQDAVRVLAERMRTVAGFVEAEQGIVGHIKAYAREEAGGCMISVTDSEDIQIKETAGTGISYEAAHIVFGISSAALEAKLREVYQL